MNTNIYLNFSGNTEEVFTFYKSIFGGEFIGGISRFKDMPGSEALIDADKNKVMHIALKVGSITLMGTDAVESMGQSVVVGNNVSISLHPETRDEAKKLFEVLSAGGKVEMPLEDAFWGAYFGAFSDKYGIHWMINCETKK